MTTTFRQPDLASDMAAAGTMRASRQPVARSIWVLLTMAVLAVAAPRASDAKPLATCKTMCQRLTDCKMSSYTKQCLDACKQYGYEASEEGRAQLLTLTRYSCKQIQSTVAGTAGDQRSSTRNASARNSSRRPPSTSTPGNDDYDDYDDTGPTASGYDPAHRSYQPVRGYDSAQTSSQAMDTSCTWVCRRLSECNLMSSQRCGEMCAMAASNGQPLRIGRESCPEIKRAFVSSKWICYAEASVGTAYGNGPWSYARTSLPASGKTRDEAYLAASSNCNAMVSVDVNTATLAGAAVDSGLCTVTQCFPPGSPLF